ncbi:MAG: metallophosphoesterase [Thermodesulfobacteriota bacterium]|nr:metallophosphoesterase [Thermodesulfobacteriota bacterium]
MYLFIADIHLRPGDLKQEQQFISWLDMARKKADKVFILGDLFDFFYSGLESRFDEVLNSLCNPKVYILPGNRDFLLSNLKKKGLNIITSEEVICDIHGTRVLLAHGHSLVRGDLGFYILHHLGWPIIRSMDRIVPAEIKDRFAKSMMNTSAIVRPPRARIPHDIAKIKKVDKIICGHLHRSVMEKGLIVLPAFLDEEAWLKWDEDGPRLEKKQ